MQFIRTYGAFVIVFLLLLMGALLLVGVLANMPPRPHGRAFTDPPLPNCARVTPGGQDADVCALLDQLKTPVP